MSIKRFKFKIPGNPVPCTRTTRRQKYYDKQYQRYEVYKEIIRLSYSLAHLELKLKSTPIPAEDQTEITSRKAFLMHLMESLLSMIGTVKKGSQNFVEVELYEIL